MKRILKQILEHGADKASLVLETQTTEEFNVIYKRLSFLRSFESSNLRISAIKNQCIANCSLNQLDDASIDAAIDTLMTSFESGTPDPAYDFSSHQKPQSWKRGKMEVDPSLVIKRLNEFIDDMKAKYPQVEYNATLSHVVNDNLHLNSNEVEFHDISACYSLILLFSSKVGKKCSSMNYTFMQIKDLDAKLIEVGAGHIQELIRQNTEQIHTKLIPASFKGDLLIAPSTAISLLANFVTGQIGNFPFISNSCKFPDSIGKQILDAKISLINATDHEDFAHIQHVTDDGYISKPAVIIENGILRHYPINLYTANKCGMQRTIGMPTSWLLKSGDSSLNDMISSIKEGILLIRQSGDGPNSDGDISFVAKNSYYIKDGKIQFPISETMVSGNLVEWLNRVKAVSQESFNNGSWQSPYLLISDVEISSK